MKDYDFKDVDSCIEALKDEDDLPRKLAANALGRIGDKRAVEPLIEVIKSDDLFLVILPAINSLGDIGDQRAVQPLIELLIEKVEEDQGTAKRCAQALGKIGDKRAIEPLLKLLNDEDRGVRMIAAMGLGALKEKRAVEPLIKELKGIHQHISHYGRPSPAEGWHDNTPSRSGKRFFSEVVDQYTILIRALGNIGDKRAIEPLIEFLENYYDLGYDVVRLSIPMDVYAYIAPWAGKALRKLWSE